MKQKIFPRSWDKERVLKVLAHYEEQSELEAVAEDARSRQLRRWRGEVLAGP